MEDRERELKRDAATHREVGPGEQRTSRGEGGEAQGMAGEPKEGHRVRAGIAGEQSRGGEVAEDAWNGETED
jgi:hypothetical protein